MREKPGRAVVVIAVIAMTGVAALVGCSSIERDGSPDAAALPIPSRPTPEAGAGRQGPAVPLVPDAVVSRLPTPARSDTPAGATAYVRHYVTSINTAYSQPNASALEGLSTPACDICLALQARATQFAVTGQHYAGPIYRTTATSASPERGGQRVVVDIDQLAVATLDRHGRRVDQNLASRARFSVSLQFTNAWQITRWDKIETSTA